MMTDNLRLKTDHWCLMTEDMNSLKCILEVHMINDLESTRGGETRGLSDTVIIEIYIIINKPKGLKIAKEDQRLIGLMVERLDGRWSIGLYQISYAVK